MLEKIFDKGRNILIGAIHFPPLLGYQNYPGKDRALENVLKDLEAFEGGGFDGVIFENNYDIPHKPEVEPPSIVQMSLLGERIKEESSIPVGVNVLWNDYRSALSIAKCLDLSYIRIPVFVDKVKADCGIIEGDADDLISFRKKINAEDIAIFTDIHVKHSKLLSNFDLEESTKLAIKKGSDGIIITGRWTGKPPQPETVKKLRGEIGNFPILIGSGVSKSNIELLFKYANGAIISTSLKEGIEREDETNVKEYNQRVKQEKVKNLVSEISN